MPDNCCVPLCCKNGYRVGLDGGKITYHSLPTTDPRKLKVFFPVVLIHTALQRKSLGKRSQHSSSAAEMPSFGSVNEESDSPTSDEMSDLRVHIAKLEEQIKFLELENKHLSKNVDELLESQFGITRFGHQFLHGISKL